MKQLLTMKRNRMIIIVVAVILILTIIGILIVDSQRAPSKIKKIDPAFAEHITAYTSGLISTESFIKVRLAEDLVGEDMVGKELEEDVFKFRPNIKGRAIWEDTRTIAFVPDEKLPYKQVYFGRFFLNRIKDVPRKLKHFDFYFQTFAQTYQFSLINVCPIDAGTPNSYQIQGKVVCADMSRSEDIENSMKASINGSELKIKWQHSEDKKVHFFVVDSIQRTANESQVKIKWNGSAIGLNENGEEKILIPAVGDFVLLRSAVMNEPEQCAVLQFSDPLNENQDLNGLIKFEDAYSFNTVIENNQIKLFANERQSGSKQIIVYPEVQNYEGKQLGKQYTENVNFEELKPSISLVGNGVILPNSNGLIFPFECVNLRAIDVKILKIYENNISQFLQVNNLSGNDELSRVGKVIFNKKVPLLSKDAIDYGQWNRFYLDLSKLIETEPGAIYKISLNFKRQYALNVCENTEYNVDEIEMVELASEIESENENADYYDDYYYDDYYYDYYYNWEERENPCNDAYYGRHREVSRNVLASDIGLIAKIGNDGKINVFASDLKSTEPLSGVIVEFYNYQQQVIFKGETDSDGKLEAKPKRIPFLIIAKYNEHRAYLKLDDGNSLSLSMFDVSGVTKNKGLNGFLYGERGVWRPGDSVFLTFILEDKEKLLPKNHPLLFEVANPQGDIINKQVCKLNTSGMYSFAFATNPDDATGTYNASVHVGGTVFYKALPIETIKPNRLKIDFAFDKKTISAADKNTKGKLSVKWLHGAVAKNLNTKIDVTFNQSNISFDNYKDYIFEDPALNYYPETKTIFDDRLNEDGEAFVSPDFNLGDNAPSLVKAHFFIKVFEEGGYFSIDRTSIPYYPYKSYVGINSPDGDKYTGRLSTDTIHTIDIVNLDYNGSSIKKNTVKVELYKVDWRWWWDRSYSSYSNYINSSYHKPIQSETLTIVNGKAKFKFKIDYPEWGRFMVRVSDVESGHSSGEILYVDWPNWASRNTDDDKQGASMLTFTADKQKYKVGDKVVLTIPSPAKGRALVSIENSTSVVNSYWVQLDKGQTKFEFPVSEKMAPNAYVHVTLIQPHAQSENDLPIRLYGIIPIYVEDPNTHITPIIEIADVLRPETNAEIKIKEKDGKAMTYTLAIVDEGLLDITNFNTPDPWNFFYAKQSIGVKTWDFYDLVMGAFGGQMERLLSIGGGEYEEDEANPENARANRFKPMVRFIGPVTIKKGETKTHKIAIPQYVGSVKTMVIASADGAYGSAERITAIRNPLMILGTLPRTLKPGEEVYLPVTVFAMENQIKNVTISVKTNSKFSVLDGNSKNLTFTKVGDQVVYFKLKVKEELGLGEVKLLATSGSNKAAHDFEIDVVNPNPRMVVNYDTVLQASTDWNFEFEAFGFKGTNKATLEVSSIPPINLGTRLRYLLDYPHGCVEQTTSAAFPQLYIEKVMSANAKTKQMTQDNVNAAIKQLARFQTSDGGFSYWPGNYESDEWGTSYAGHFLIEAEAKGFDVPLTMKKRWISYQQKRARNYSKKKNAYYNTELAQAYRLYTLALANSPELPAMNRMREMKDISYLAKWRLAAAYALAGKSNIALEIINNLSYTVADYWELSYTYGSGTRDRAMILETLTILGETVKSAIIVKDLSKELNSDRWMSTQTTAYTLLAMSKFIEKNKLSKYVQLQYSMNKGKMETINSDIPLIQKEFELDLHSKNNFVLENKGKGLLYARLIVEGVPIAGKEIDQENDLKINVSYQTTTGSPIDPVKIEQGTDFIALVSVSNPGMRGTYRELALNQVFPSGWEIHNTRMDEYQSSHTSSYYTYQDVRDDRIYTYFYLLPNETKTFKVLINASYAGIFYLPGINCEAMYDATINARVSGKWVSVDRW